MISDENIAAAQIAQIFGSELLKAQQSARTDGGSTPEFVKINPKQFLVNNSPRAVEQRRHEEQRLMQMLQKEAEAAYPIAEAPSPSQANIDPSLPTTIENISNSPKTAITVGRLQTSAPSTPFQESTLERIAQSLEKIANSLDTVEILVKKKKTKRPRLKQDEIHS